MPASMNSLPAGEYLVYINYFDLQYANVERLYERYGRQLIVDNVQAFYRGAYKDCWSFNSARKFYGVPDGAYLYGPALPQDIRERNAAYSIEHLLYRAMHENEKAYGLYKRQEHGMTTDVRLMSELSAALLAHTDHAFAMERRRQNFRLLHRALGHINHFPGLDEIGDEAVPFFYPLLPAIPLSRASLVEQRLFIPQFWPERCETVAAGTMEAALVQDLLPLPIDQRYGEREMLEIVQIIQYEYQGKISHHPGH